MRGIILIAFALFSSIIMRSSNLFIDISYSARDFKRAKKGFESVIFI